MFKTKTKYTWMIVAPCLLASCLVAFWYLFNIPDYFKIKYTVSFTDLSLASDKKTKRHSAFVTAAKQYLPMHNLKCSTKNISKQTQSKTAKSKTSYTCQNTFNAKSKQLKHINQLKKNKRHGYAQRKTYLEQLNETVHTVKAQRQRLDDMESDLLIYEQALNQKESQWLKDWKVNYYKLHSEIKSSEKQVNYFKSLITLAFDQDEKENYQSQLKYQQRSHKEIDLLLREHFKVCDNVNSQHLQAHCDTLHKIHDLSLDTSIKLHKSDAIKKKLDANTSNDWFALEDQNQWLVSKIQSSIIYISFKKIVLSLGLLWILFVMLLKLTDVYKNNLKSNKSKLSQTIEDGLNTVERVQAVFHAPYFGNLRDLEQNTNPNMHEPDIHELDMHDKQKSENT